MAEKEGFEPSIPLPVYTLSRGARSATLPFLHYYMAEELGFEPRQLYAFTGFQDRPLSRSDIPPCFHNVDNIIIISLFCQLLFFQYHFYCSLLIFSNNFILIFSSFSNFFLTQRRKGHKVSQKFHHFFVINIYPEIKKQKKLTRFTEFIFLVSSCL